jgi:hypothetical protein
MQFLLTEEEHRDLVVRAKIRSDDEHKRLQRVCTMAAEHTPVTRDWEPNEPPRPWGCILTNSADYCDHCPVRQDCPYTRKELSK